MASGVLIVEDNNDCRNMLDLFLTRMGYTVIQARDGLEGVEQAIRCRPQLILMDLMMPKMNGMDATRQLKENPITKDIPIVICTAFGTEAYSNSTLVESAAEIVQKPIRLEKLRSLLHKYSCEPTQKAQQAAAQNQGNPAANLFSQR
jgi:CheY-like chemotaxis protein